MMQTNPVIASPAPPPMKKHRSTGHSGSGNSSNNSATSHSFYQQTQQQHQATTTMRQPPPPPMGSRTNSNIRGGNGRVNGSTGSTAFSQTHNGASKSNKQTSMHHQQQPYRPTRTHQPYPTEGGYVSDTSVNSTQSTSSIVSQHSIGTSGIDIMADEAIARRRVELQRLKQRLQQGSNNSGSTSSDARSRQHGRSNNPPPPPFPPNSHGTKSSNNLTHSPLRNNRFGSARSVPVPVTTSPPPADQSWYIHTSANSNHVRPPPMMPTAPSHATHTIMGVGLSTTTEDGSVASVASSITAASANHRAQAQHQSYSQPQPQTYSQQPISAQYSQRNAQYSQPNAQ